MSVLPIRQPKPTPRTSSDGILPDQDGRFESAAKKRENTDAATRQASHRPWRPKRVLITPAASQQAFGRSMCRRIESLGIEVTELSANRIMTPKRLSNRRRYAWAKSTLAIVNAPPGQFKLQPIPPSADYQFHLATGCPAHCQYCYLAGSLSGAPVVKAFANLPDILENLNRFGDDSETTSFEVSCYTDPLGIEHLTGSLRRCIEWFGSKDNRGDRTLRWVSKFAAVDDLLTLQHRGRTQCRFSMNAHGATGFMEGGAASVSQRLDACRRMADAGYPIGIVLAPIMPIENWQTAYADLLDRIEDKLGSRQVTFELITHRFTPGSKEVLQQWYPNTALDLDEQTREKKRNKFGGVKYVYPKEQMRQMKPWFENQIGQRFGRGEILYWT